jgi:hypothetical protein
MITTDSLFEWASIFGIKVVFKNLKGIDSGPLGLADADSKTIELDQSLIDSPRQLKAILAEEIGHILYPPRPGHIRYHSRGFWQRADCESIRQSVAQDERKALDWATSVLLPDVEFDRIMENGNLSLSEIAECYEVEPLFAKHKINYYRRKERMSGRKVKWKDVIRRV